MRNFVFASSAALLLIFATYAAFGPNDRVRADVLGAMTAMMFLFVVPAVALAWFRRWLPFAVILVCVTGWMWLSIYVAGKISN